MVIVEKPRCPGQPVNCCSVMNSNNRERPVMTSGITIGDEIIPENKVRPLNRPNRASASPDMVPRIVAMLADVTAILTLRSRASRTCSF